PLLPPLSTLFPYTTLFRSFYPPVDVPAHLFHHPYGPKCPFGQMGTTPSRDGPVPPLPMGLLDLHGQYSGISQMDGKKEPLLCPQDRKSTRLNSSHVKISYA